MNKLSHIISQLPPEDVLLIQKDIEEGNLARVVRDRLAELELPQKVCPVCNAPVDDNAPFVLYFGTGIRKKARFDGIDCLQFFLREMQGERQKRVKKK
jgi:hypothetical protein